MKHIECLQHECDNHQDLQDVLKSCDLPEIVVRVLNDEFDWSENDEDNDVRGR